MLAIADIEEGAKVNRKYCYLKQSIGTARASWVVYKFKVLHGKEMN